MRVRRRRRPGAPLAGGRQRLLRWLAHWKQLRSDAAHVADVGALLRLNASLEAEAAELRRRAASLRDELSQIELQSKRLGATLRELQQLKQGA